MNNEQKKHLRRLMNKTRKFYLSAQAAEDAIFNYIHEICDVEDLEFIEVSHLVDIADNNLKNGITCWLNYGDGDMEAAVKEISKLPIRGSGKNA